MILLAFVGLIFLLWVLSKALTNIGDAFQKLGDYIATREAYKARTPVIPPPDRGLAEKTKAVKGEGTDAEYQRRIQKEIDEITGA